ncbi:hypothetical protein KOR34_16200 [Posidoniimonas corsicana]|uniref:Uncharacterized protein n=1 Tax=Posidoniimonas corsicana TaxID=1938618 RepID=A0A5C5VFM0_9BACT|nr:hypothetical protein [Posidoniimonas corsicana]TWT36680.1 hypothetical protein KOR34_16200 [Posidoniimonas corsicana]
MDGTLPRPTLLLTICAAYVWAAAAQAASPESDASGITFGRLAEPSSHRMDQTTRVGLSLKTQVRKQAEVLNKQQSQVTRNRRRVLEPALVEDGVATAAYVRYLRSESVHDGGEPKSDPIAGKSYYCRRVGDTIRVQTADGKTPPPEESRLVAENMETLGKPNPLAEYLAGKTVAIGDKLTLPAEVAQRLLGLGGALGEVTKFEMTLTKVATVEDASCAVFLADIEAQRTDSSQMRMMVAGPMTIQAETCRAVSSELSGPIGMSHSLNDPRGRLQLDSTGRVEVRVSSRPAGRGVVAR